MYNDCTVAPYQQFNDHESWYIELCCHNKEKSIPLDVQKIDIPTSLRIGKKYKF